MAYTIFHIPMGFRLYDRERNKVVSINEEEYRALYHIGLKDAGTNDREILRALQRKGYCCESTLTAIRHPFTDVAMSMLSEKVSDLVLQVTQNCNLRCSYCTFSGKYYNRGHTAMSMTNEMAFQAVDFLFLHSTGINEVTIGFYGGEPLLEFRLIQEVVNYVETQYPERSVKYNLTTNLTLLSDEMITYFTDKKFQIMISIDGPQEIQDKYRRFANGEGSFFTVAKNAKKLKETDNDYFGNCSTNTVASPNEDFERIREFLDTDGLFGELDSRLSTISDSGLKKEVQYNEEFYSVMQREQFKLFLSMVGELDSKKVSGVYSQHKTTLLKMYIALKTGGTKDTTESHPGGPCLPGAKKLFVDVFGNFYPCEKISENKIFQIGNLHDGFDKEKISNFLNVGQCTAEQCINCWAFMHCTTCAVAMVDGGELSESKRSTKCTEVLSSTLDIISDLETLLFYRCGFENDE